MDDDNILSKQEIYQEEFRKLMAADPAGLLRTEAIVAAAQDPSSPLHDYFEWDDKEAAHEYRITQAFQLVRRVKVYIEPLNISVRAYASLDIDRANGGGWRSLTDVMANTDLRTSLLSTALRELQSMESRYSHLTELADVWDAAHGIDIVQPRKRKVKVTEAQ